MPGLRGFFVAAGGSINGIVGAGGVGKTVAEWILEGDTEIDVHELDVRRFGPHLSHKPYLVEACREVYRYYYHMRYPGDENEWGRPYRTSPFYERLKDFGAVFGHKNGWERANYFDPGKPWRQAGADQNAWGWTRPPYFEPRGRRSPGGARAGGPLRHDLLRQDRRARPGRARLPAEAGRQRPRPAGRQHRLHPVPEPARAGSKAM